jgi:long-chain acyl-CoA synthetase
MVTYAERPWTKHYDSGVPATLEPYPDKALHDFLHEAAQKSPNNIALSTQLKAPLIGRQSNPTTYGELDRSSDALAAALTDLGLKKGDRVILMMPNCVAFVISYYGVSTP